MDVGSLHGTIIHTFGIQNQWSDVMKRTVRIPIVEFARKASQVLPQSDGMVRRKGVIFRSGVYPDQKFAMSPAELRALAAEFSEPVPVDHGHPRSDGPLDGKLGHVESVEASEDGTTLFGTVALPRWLEDLMGDARRLVSAKFDPLTKRLARLSLVTRPIISDAELQAAFACACGQEADVDTESEPEIFPMSKPNDDWKAAAIAKLEAMDDDEREGVLDAILSDVAPEPELDAGPEAHSAPAADPAPSAAEFALRQQLDVLMAKDRRREAETFADRLIRDGKIAPAQKPGVMANHIQAAIDDAAGTAEFAKAKGSPPTRVAAIEAMFAALPSHSLLAEEMPTFGHVLSNGVADPEAAKAAKDARISALMNQTPLGRSAIASN